MVDLLKEELISSLKNELVILNFENDCKKICKKVLTDNNVCVIMNIQTNQGGRDMSEIKLLPCPFCGGESLLRDRYAIGVASTKHYIRECHHCKATFAHWFRSIKRANKAWNRRASNDINVATNADRIRNMMDEELAEISVYCTTELDYDEGLDGEWRECGEFEIWHSVFTADTYGSEEDAIAYTLDWLKQPTKEE